VLAAIRNQCFGALWRGFQMKLQRENLFVVDEALVRAGHTARKMSRMLGYIEGFAVPVKGFSKFREHGGQRRHIDPGRALNRKPANLCIGIWTHRRAKYLRDQLCAEANAK